MAQFERPQTPPGKAYAVFHSQCRQREIEHALIKMKLCPDPIVPPRMKDMAFQIYPVNAVLADPSQFEPALKPLIADAPEWKRAKANYFMRASLPGASDKETLFVLDHVFSVLWDCSSVLYNCGKPVPNMDMYIINQAGGVVSKLRMDMYETFATVLARVAEKRCQAATI